MGASRWIAHGIKIDRIQIYNLCGELGLMIRGVTTYIYRWLRYRLLSTVNQDEVEALVPLFRKTRDPVIYEGVVSAVGNVMSWEAAKDGFVGVPGTQS